MLFKAEMKIYLEQSIQSTKIRVSRSEYEYPDYSLQSFPACCQGAGKWWQTSCPRPNLSSLFRNETQHQMLVSPFYCNLWPRYKLVITWTHQSISWDEFQMMSDSRQDHDSWPCLEAYPAHCKQWTLLTWLNFKIKIGNIFTGLWHLERKFYSGARHLCR